jgi:hypothetical protein
MKAVSWYGAESTFFRMIPWGGRFRGITEESERMLTFPEHDKVVEFGILLLQSEV